MTPSVGWLAYNPDDVRPGWGALALVIVLAIATFLLWRSMNTQLGKIQMPPRERPSRFPEGPEVDESEKRDERPPTPPGD